jgi:hypothetical protein
MPCRSREEGIAYVGQPVMSPAFIDFTEDRFVAIGAPRKAEAYWRKLTFAYERQYRELVEALRAGGQPTLPSRQDPRYTWPRTPADFDSWWPLMPSPQEPGGADQ